MKWVALSNNSFKPCLVNQEVSFNRLLRLRIPAEGLFTLRFIATAQTQRRTSSLVVIDYLIIESLLEYY